jgi:hypothetical protein
MGAIENLLGASERKKLHPINDLPWTDAPEKQKYWMPQELISLHGTPEFEALNEAQKIQLSQLEFSLMCSVSASGEKEVIANMATRMLKQRYAKFRPYFFHFIGEENNHIHMFAEFCERYGEFFPVLYTYAQGEVWEHPETSDLLTFAHVLIFEELGQGLNEIIAKDENVPKLVRAINQYHVDDEGRHISFGRLLVREFAEDTRKKVSEAEWRKLQEHVAKYLATRHIDYHNMRIYKSIGIPDAFQVRQRLIETRDEQFFARSPRALKRINSLKNFLQEVQLMVPLGTITSISTLKE